MDTNDIIQVVSPIDIYKPDFSYYEMNNNNANSNMDATQVHYNQPTQPTYLPEKSGFNFAPVIKIVNGNDNSSDTTQKEPFYGGGIDNPLLQEQKQFLSF